MTSIKVNKLIPEKRWKTCWTTYHTGVAKKNVMCFDFFNNIKSIIYSGIEIVLPTGYSMEYKEILTHLWCLCGIEFWEYNSYNKKMSGDIK